MNKIKSLSIQLFKMGFEEESFLLSTMFAVNKIFSKVASDQWGPKFREEDLYFSTAKNGRDIYDRLGQESEIIKWLNNHFAPYFEKMFKDVMFAGIENQQSRIQSKRGDDENIINEFIKSWKSGPTEIWEEEGSGGITEGRVIDLSDIKSLINFKINTIINGVINDENTRDIIKKLEGKTEKEIKDLKTLTIRNILENDSSLLDLYTKVDKEEAAKKIQDRLNKDTVYKDTCDNIILRNRNPAGIAEEIKQEIESIIKEINLRLKDQDMAIPIPYSFPITGNPHKIIPGNPPVGGQDPTVEY